MFFLLLASYIYLAGSLSVCSSACLFTNGPKREREVTKQVGNQTMDIMRQCFPTDKSHTFSIYFHLVYLSKNHQLLPEIIISASVSFSMCFVIFSFLSQYNINGPEVTAS